MKLRIQQLNPTVGDLSGNSEQIVEAQQKAESAGVDLLILPELVVCGYSPMDLLERESFREAIYEVNETIVNGSGETAVLFGTVTKNRSEYGRKCYNSALLAHRGEQLARVNKSLLPTYDVFDDLRYFEPNREYETVSFKGVEFGITICEDIWYNENDIQYHTYKVNPAGLLVESGADAIINISASPFTKTKPQSRQEMLQSHARRLEVPLFYANQVGANTELIFDGDSMAVDSGAEIKCRLSLFEADFGDIDWNPEDGAVTHSGPPPGDLPGRTEGIFSALVLGLRDYIEKTGVADKVILGLSGGLDSALVACIAREALGSDAVVGVTLPSGFSSKGSVTDSEQLAENLEIKLHNYSIEGLFRDFRHLLEPVLGTESIGVAAENLQPRIRMTVLMALANKLGYMLLNTGNKSELATGYCTLYGDMAGGLGIITDLYKTEVRELSHWLNNEYYQDQVIPESTLEKAPSAELRPDQKDSDTLPPYEVLDPILEQYIEKQSSRDAIIGEGYEAETVNQVIRLVERNEYKRYQGVPGLKVSTKAFGSGRRWPIAQNWKETR